jgi:hypothetical protein
VRPLFGKNFPVIFSSPPPPTTHTELKTPGVKGQMILGSLGVGDFFRKTHTFIEVFSSKVSTAGALFSFIDKLSEILDFLAILLKKFHRTSDVFVFFFLRVSINQAHPDPDVFNIMMYLWMDPSINTS